MKKIFLKKCKRVSTLPCIGVISVEWNGESGFYITQMLFDPGSGIKNEFTGIRFYAESMRAVEAFLQEIPRLYGIKDDLEVAIPDQEKVS